VIPVYRTSRWGPTLSIFTLRRYRTCVKNREDVQMKLAELGLGERLKVRHRRSVARDSPVRVALAAENSVAAATAPRGRRALSGRTTGMRKILRGGWLGAVPRGGRSTVTRTRLPPPVGVVLHPAHWVCSVIVDEIWSELNTRMPKASFLTLPVCV
jgi:hypothetical protein